jgi:integrase
MRDVTAVYLVKRSRTLPSGKKVKYWVLRWADSRGKIRSESIGKVGTMPKREAERKRREKETALGSGRARRDRPQKMTLKQFLEMDREAIAGDVRDATLLEHEYASKHAIDALGENRSLESIGPAEATAIKAHLFSSDGRRKRSPATVAKVLRTLRSAFNRGIRSGIITDNPFTHLRLPRYEGKPKRIFTRREAAMLLEVAPDHWWTTLIRLLLTSGLRREEALNLRWSDVSFDDGVVHVNRKRSGTLIIDGRTYHTWAWSAKARHSYRTIPIPAETSEALRQQQSLMKGSPYVFITVNRLEQLQRHITGDGRLPSQIKPMWNMLATFHDIQRRAEARLCELDIKAGREPYKWPLGTLHDLRKTYCTWLAEHVPMNVLREWAGHASITTTAEFYLATGDAAADRARKALCLIAAEVSATDAKSP